MAYSLEEIKENEKYSIFNGAAAIISQSFIAGFIPLFAIEVLKANNQQIGWISSMPALMSIIAMIPGAIWLNHLTSKKMFTMVNITLARLSLLLIILIPFLNNLNLAWVLVGLIALMNFPTALATLSWQSLIGDLVPDERRGTFFSQRSRILTIVGMVATFVAGYGLNFFDESDPLPFQIMFALGFLFGLVEIYYLFKHQEKTLLIKKKVKSGHIKLSKRIKSLGVFFEDRQYRAFLICAILFNFGWQIAWPLFTIYQINVAQANALWISIFTVANQLTQILSYRWWGRLSDKYGNSMMLFVAAVGMMSAPILTVLSKNFIYLTIVNLWTGISVAGTVMLLFNQLLKVSPAEGRTNYIANYNIMIAVIGVIAPQIGVFLLEHFGMFNSMAISSILRLLGGISFLYVYLYIERNKPWKKNRKKMVLGMK
jgi:MFS family permease